MSTVLQMLRVSLILNVSFFVYEINVSNLKLPVFLFYSRSRKEKEPVCDVEVFLLKKRTKSRRI